LKSGVLGTLAAADGSADPQTALRYRQEILERGGSRPALESFVAFRGRKPTVDALLRHSGMATSSAQCPMREASGRRLS
jgi:oligopeptidase A